MTASLGAALDLPLGVWRGATLFGFANNLLGEDYYLSRDTAFDEAVIGAPRTLGVGARLEF